LVTQATGQVKLFKIDKINKGLILRNIKNTSNPQEIRI
jgi:hypothetical protein